MKSSRNALYSIILQKIVDKIRQVLYNKSTKDQIEVTPS